MKVQLHHHKGFKLKYEGVREVPKRILRIDEIGRGVIAMIE